MGWMHASGHQTSKNFQDRRLTVRHTDTQTRGQTYPRQRLFHRRMASSRGRANAALAEKADVLCLKLKQRQIVGSYAAAKGTVDLLKQLVSSTKVGSAQELLEEVRAVGVKVQEARPIGTHLGLRAPCTR